MFDEFASGVWGGGREGGRKGVGGIVERKREKEWEEMEESRKREEEKEMR